MTDMRKEYDFSKGVRGVHAARFREGVRIVVTDAGSDFEDEHAVPHDSDAPAKGTKKPENLRAQVRVRNTKESSLY